VEKKFYILAKVFICINMYHYLLYRQDIVIQNEMDRQTTYTDDSNARTFQY